VKAADPQEVGNLEVATKTGKRWIAWGLILGCFYRNRSELVLRREKVEESKERKG